MPTHSTNMEKQLNRNQIQEIMNQRPQSMSKQAVIDGLVARGYKLEGFNDKPKENILQKAGGFIKETAQDIAQIPSDIVKAGEKGAEKITTAFDKGIAGEQTPLSSGFQVMGALAGSGAGAIESVAKGAVKAVLPQSVENKVKEVASQFGEAVASNPQVQNLVGWYGNLPEGTQRNIDAAGGIASLVANFAGGQAVGKGATVTGEAVKTGTTATKQAVKTGAEAIGTNAAKVGQAVTDVVEPVTGTIGAVKRNIGAVS